MIYYAIQALAAPGQEQALRESVATYNKVIQAHGGNPVGNFTVAVGSGVGSVVSIVGYDSAAAAAAANEDLESDPDWQNLITKVRPLITTLNISVLRPLPDSPQQ